MPRKKHDWEKIEAEIRAGTLSLREIARRNDISDTALRKRMKTHNIKRDLTQKVNQLVRAKMVRSEVRTTDAQSDNEAAEKFSDRVAEILLLQRSDINNLRNMEASLLEELGQGPEKLWIGQHQGKVITKKVGLTVSERAGTLRDLATVQHKRIQLERQAYNVDSDDSGGDDDWSLKPADKKLLGRAARILAAQVVKKQVEQGGDDG